jgi:DNA-directed RNA polymerase subunit RPC12/RpoP
MTAACSECVNARDGWLPPREATLTWHKSLFDEQHVCPRCYSKLLMRERRGAAKGENGRS